MVKARKGKEPVQPQKMAPALHPVVSVRFRDNLLEKRSRDG